MGCSLCFCLKWPKQNQLHDCSSRIRCETWILITKGHAMAKDFVNALQRGSFSALDTLICVNMLIHVNMHDSETEMIENHGFRRANPTMRLQRCFLQDIDCLWLLDNLRERIRQCEIAFGDQVKRKIANCKMHKL